MSADDKSLPTTIPVPAGSSNSSQGAPLNVSASEELAAGDKAAGEQATGESAPAVAAVATSQTQDPPGTKAPDGQFSRLQGIAGWPQELLMKARVMVVGVGALGNEVVKCLALTGVGHILLVDFDHVEASNLTRSVLFRREDGASGMSKAGAAKRTAEALNLNPDGCVQAYEGNLADLGRGIYQRMDLVFCAVDSRAARLLLNRTMREVGGPWVDGGFQFLNPWGGAISLYDAGDPEAPCYACSIKPEVVMQTLDEAKGISCGLIGKELREQGFISSTPTLASIVGGMQVQEGFRLLATRAGMVDDDDEIGDLALNRQISVDTRGRTFQIINKRARTEVCYEHRSNQRIGEVTPFPGWRSERTTLGELFADLQAHLGTPQLRIAMPSPQVYRFKCLDCQEETWLSPFVSAFTFTYRQRKSQISCGKCGASGARIFAHGDFEELLPDARLTQHCKDMTLAAAGFRPLEIIQVLYYNPKPGVCWAEITGDQEAWFPSHD